MTRTQPLIVYDTRRRNKYFTITNLHPTFPIFPSDVIYIEIWHFATKQSFILMLYFYAYILDTSFIVKHLTGLWNI